MLGPDRSASAAARHTAAELQRLEAEAQYHRDRLDLYRARVVSTRPTSPSRLRELERTAEAASLRLRDARDRIRLRDERSRGAERESASDRVAGR